MFLCTSKLKDTETVGSFDQEIENRGTRRKNVIGLLRDLGYWIKECEIIGEQMPFMHCMILEKFCRWRKWQGRAVELN